MQIAICIMAFLTTVTIICLSVFIFLKTYRSDGDNNLVDYLPLEEQSAELLIIEENTKVLDDNKKP